MKRIIFGIGIFVCLLLFSKAVLANPFNVFGFDSASTAMGGAYTSLANGVTATWFNPAGLSEAKHAEVELGYFYGRTSVDVKMSGPHPDYPSVNSNPLMDAAEKETPTEGYLIGLNVPPGSKKLATGVVLYFPNERLYEEIFEDERNPFVLDYQRQTKHLMAIPALSYEIVPMVSVGLGLMVGAHTYVINRAGKTLVGNEEGYLSTWTAPEFGILIKPLDGLKIGVAYRGKYSANSGAVISMFGPPITLKGVTLYSPLQVAGGASYLYDKLTVALDVVYTRWSDFEPPFITATGPDGTPIATYSDVNFSDTYTPRLGAEYRLIDFLTLRAGYYFKASPVPEQTGESNIIDSDTHVGSLGVGVAVPLPKFITENPLKVDLHVQYQKLTERSYTKGGDVEKFNAGRPGYSFDGSALSGGITVSFALD